MSKHQNHRDQAPGGSQRQLRVGELIRHAVADILTRGDVHDPVLEGHLITVPEVRMSPDLRLATIFVMPLGGRDADEVVAALERQQEISCAARSPIASTCDSRPISASASTNASTKPSASISCCARPR